MNKIVLTFIGVIIIVVVAGFLFKNIMSSDQQSATTNIQPTQTSASETTESNGKHTIEIKNFAFSPLILTAKVGDTVTFTNEDSADHTATEEYKVFDTGTLSQGQSKTVTLDKPGTYSYYCAFHPNMKGQIIVQ